MLAPVDDQVVDCYYALFDRLFSQPFAARIPERLRRDAVVRQVEEAAGAASQSLTLFFTTQQLTEQQTSDLLRGFTPLPQLLSLDGLAHAKATPEAMVETLLRDCPCPEAARQAGHETIYRVALHSIIQVLMLVAPVMAEWQRLNFSSVFELLRRVINRLNQIRGQIESTFQVSNAYYWLFFHPQALDAERLVQQLQGWRSMTPLQMCELSHIVHCHGSEAVLVAMASDAEMYAAPGPKFRHESNYGSQGEVAVLGLSSRAIRSDTPGVAAAFL